ncbi:MAG: alpha/beta hydrolase [Proteobacteria bacterium]|nr:alpha/beta hydrolase [Pseudomonadota bacterium]
MTDDAAYWRAPPGVRRAYVDGRFGQLHYRIARPESPSAAPLLCVHSSPNSGRMYAALLSRIGRDRIALAPDTPGFGESDAPSTPPGIADYAAQMGEFLDALAIPEADVMGYHTGSKICVELALQRPRLVRRLVLVSAPLYTDAELARQMADHGSPHFDEDGSHLQRRWQWLMKYRQPGAPLSLVQRNFMEGLRGGDTAWWGHRAAFAYQHRDHLPEVTQPVLVLNPEDDLQAQTARLKDELDGIELVDLPGWSHGFCDTHADELAERLRRFLDAPGEVAAAPRAPRDAPLKPAPRRRSVRRRFVDGPHGQIHLRIAEPRSPSATPLVCLHMSPNSGRIYETLLEEMGRDRLVLAPDTPGFGESDAPDTPPRIEDYAAAMAGLIDGLALPRVDVMGYHTGSMTAVELALRRPDLVRRVVMIAAPIYTPEEQADRQRHNTPRTLSEDGSHLTERWRFMRRFYGEDVPISIVARNFAEGGRGGPLAWWGHRAAFEYPLADKLPRVAQPVLVLNPDDDLAEQTPRAEALLRSGRVRRLPGYSHGMLDVHTAEIGGILREFLNGG